MRHCFHYMQIIMKRLKQKVNSRYYLHRYAFILWTSQLSTIVFGNDDGLSRAPNSYFYTLFE